jgi:hypothetical protein
LVPWDTNSDEDSEDSKEDHDDDNISDDINDSTTSTNIVDDAQDNANDHDCSMVTEAVMQYDISFIASKYVEQTKLLKMLNDAHVPPFFYQDILLNWVKEGNQ